MTTRDEMIAGAKHLFDHQLTVDYIITHEPCPNHVVSGIRQDIHRSALQAFFEEILMQVTYKQWFFGAQHVDRTMSNRHIAVFEQIIAPDSQTLSSPKRGTRRKK